MNKCENSFLPRYLVRLSQSVATLKFEMLIQLEFVIIPSTNFSYYLLPPFSLSLSLYYIIFLFASCRTYKTDDRITQIPTNIAVIKYTTQCAHLHHYLFKLFFLDFNIRVMYRCMYTHGHPFGVFMCVGLLTSLLSNVYYMNIYHSNA